MRVLVIGAGNMGLTYAEGMSKSSLLNRHNLMIYDKSPELIASLGKIPHFDVYDKLEDCLPQADVIFLAVKPYHCDVLFEEMKPMINNGQIMAVSYTHLRAHETKANLVCRLLLEK